MGNPEIGFSDVKKISETRAREIHSGGLLISTFGSSMSVRELSSYFANLDKNFLLFELNDEYSATNITKGDIQSKLFNYIKKDVDVINSEDISKSEEKDIDLYLDSLSYNDKLLEVDQLIDKGVENLSEYDKSLLNKLTSKLL